MNRFVAVRSASCKDGSRRGSRTLWPQERLPATAARSASSSMFGKTRLAGLP
jgi:hypothetical protein